MNDRWYNPKSNIQSPLLFNKTTTHFNFTMAPQLSMAMWLSSMNKMWLNKNCDFPDTSLLANHLFFISFVFPASHWLGNCDNWAVLNPEMEANVEAGWAALRIYKTLVTRAARPPYCGLSY